MTTLAPGSCVEPPDRLRVDSERVMIPLSVTDRAGRAVPGLERTDFTVTEDGAPQPVRALSMWDAPVSIGVVFDTSGSMAGEMHAARESISELFHESSPEDQAFLIRFANTPSFDTGFVHGSGEISRRLLLCSPRGAAALVVVTDGGDNHSRRSFTELLATARERDVQIFVLSIRRDPRDLDEWRGRVQLDRLADDTGGRLFVVDRDDQIQHAIAEVAESIRTQYLLFFQPLKSIHDGSWRRVRLRLRPVSKESSYRIRFRNGYYSPRSLCPASIQVRLPSARPCGMARPDPGIAAE